MDVKKNETSQIRTVWVDRGRRDTSRHPKEWAKHVTKHGAGEIFFNSIDHDGARKGYDEFTVKELCQTVSIPVIAFGGIFRWPQLIKGFEAGAEGLAVANQLHYTEHAARKAKAISSELGSRLGLRVKVKLKERISLMRYCKKCLYPENAKPTIIFDENGYAVDVIILTAEKILK